MEVFYDAFADAEPTDSAIGQPVILPPVLSVDDAGDVTIAFATGDQDLTTPAPTTQNRVVSLTETLNDSNEFVARVNWVQPLTNGDRVTGPMVLFNRGLYYAASRPPGASVGACNVGESQVYGAHYEISQNRADAVANPDPLSGPSPAPGQPELEILSEPGLTFGVSLQAQPSCSTAEEVVSGNDSFGYGTVTMSQTVAPTKYFLTFEVSGNSKDPRGVLEISQPLEDLHVPVTFDSWALIYE
jgi:type IV pilus assembly protein PilY1